MRISSRGLIAAITAPVLMIAVANAQSAPQDEDQRLNRLKVTLRQAQANAKEVRGRITEQSDKVAQLRRRLASYEQDRARAVRLYREAEGEVNRAMTETARRAAQAKLNRAALDLKPTDNQVTRMTREVNEAEKTLLNRQRDLVTAEKYIADLQRDVDAASQKSP